MHSGYLAKEAFAKVLEVKDDKTNFTQKYKLLYNNQSVISNYKKPTQNESKAQILAREQFQNQFFDLLAALKKWGQENAFGDQALISIDQFKNKFFNEAYSGNQTNEYFDAIKQFLEQIWFSLTDIKISAQQKQSAFDHLITDAFPNCSPGLYGHLEDILFALNNDISLPRWLAEMRTNLIRCYADQHITKKQIHEAYWVHVRNAFMMYAIHDGWAPISTIYKNSDPYLIHCEIDSEDITEFAEYLENHYTPKAILECMTSNFKNELNKLLKSKNIEAKNEWFSYSLSFIKSSEEILDKIELKINAIDIFNLNDDNTGIRFDASRFKLIFLNYCKENEKLFNKNNWRVKNLKSGYQYYYFDDDVWDIVWIEHPEQGKKLIETEVERHALMLDPLVSNWHERNKMKLPILIGNKGEKLGKLLNVISAKWTDVLAYLGYDYIRTTISSLREVKNLLEQIPAERRAELNPFLSLVAKDIFFQAVKENSLSLIKILIEEVKLTPTHAMNAAIMSGNLKILMHCVKEYKVDVDALQDGETLLSIAINKCNSIEQFAIVKYLVNECKADVNVRLSSGMTALMCAARDGWVGITKFLIQEVKTDHQLKDDRGYTALHYAVDYLQIETVKWLIQEAGWNPYEKTLAGLTAFDLAKATHDNDMINWFAEELLNRQKITCLLDKIDAKPDEILTYIVQVPPLAWPEKFQDLLKSKIIDSKMLGQVLLQVKDKKNWSAVVNFLGVHYVKSILKEPTELEQLIEQIPREFRTDLRPVLHLCNRIYLHRVLVEKRLPLFKVLIKEVGLPDNEDILHFVTKMGNLEAVKFLVQEGFNVDQKDIKGRAALNIALEKGHMDIARYLVMEVKAAYVRHQDEPGNYRWDQWVKAMSCFATIFSKMKLKKLSDFDDYCFTLISLVDASVSLPHSKQYQPFFNELKQLMIEYSQYPFIINEMKNIIKNKIHEYSHMSIVDKNVLLMINNMELYIKIRPIVPIIDQFKNTLDITNRHYGLFKEYKQNDDIKNVIIAMSRR